MKTYLILALLAFSLVGCKKTEAEKKEERRIKIEKEMKEKKQIKSAVKKALK